MSNLSSGTGTGHDDRGKQELLRSVVAMTPEQQMGWINDQRQAMGRSSAVAYVLQVLAEDTSDKLTSWYAEHIVLEMGTHEKRYQDPAFRQLVERWSNDTSNPTRQYRAMMARFGHVSISDDAIPSFIQKLPPDSPGRETAMKIMASRDNRQHKARQEGLKEHDLNAWALTADPDSAALRGHALSMANPFALMRRYEGRPGQMWHDVRDLVGLVEDTKQPGLARALSARYVVEGYTALYNEGSAGERDNRLWANEYRPSLLASGVLLQWRFGDDLRYGEDIFRGDPSPYILSKFFNERSSRTSITRDLIRSVADHVVTLSDASFCLDYSALAVMLELQAASDDKLWTMDDAQRLARIALCEHAPAYLQVAALHALAVTDNRTKDYAQRLCKRIFYGEDIKSFGSDTVIPQSPLATTKYSDAQVTAARQMLEEVEALPQYDDDYENTALSDSTPTIADMDPATSGRRPENSFLDLGDDADTFLRLPRGDAAINTILDTIEQGRVPEVSEQLLSRCRNVIAGTLPPGNAAFGAILRQLIGLGGTGYIDDNNDVEAWIKVFRGTLDPERKSLAFDELGAHCRQLHGRQEKLNTELLEMLLVEAGSLDSDHRTLAIDYLGHAANIDSRIADRLGNCYIEGRNASEDVVVQYALEALVTRATYDPLSFKKLAELARDELRLGQRTVAEILTVPSVIYSADNVVHPAYMEAIAILCKPDFYPDLPLTEAAVDAVIYHYPDPEGSDMVIALYKEHTDAPAEYREKLCIALSDKPLTPKLEEFWREVFITDANEAPKNGALCLSNIAVQGHAQAVGLISEILEARTGNLRISAAKALANIRDVPAATEKVKGLLVSPWDGDAAVDIEVRKALLAGVPLSEITDLLKQALTAAQQDKLALSDDTRALFAHTLAYFCGTDKQSELDRIRWILDYGASDLAVQPNIGVQLHRSGLLARIPELGVADCIKLATKFVHYAPVRVAALDSFNLVLKEDTKRRLVSSPDETLQNSVNHQQLQAALDAVFYHRESWDVVSAALAFLTGPNALALLMEADLSWGDDAGDKTRSQDRQKSNAQLTYSLLQNVYDQDLKNAVAFCYAWASHQRSRGRSIEMPALDQILYTLLSGSPNLDLQTSNYIKTIIDRLKVW